MAINDKSPATLADEKHERLIRGILSSEFGREIVDLEPVQRGTKQCGCCKGSACRFYNTYVYRLRVKSSGLDSQQPFNSRNQDGVSPLPDDVSNLVIRLTSQNTDLNRDIQVQSEAAAMCLFKEALQPLDPSLIPTLYGWASNSEGHGWLLTGLLPGESLGDKFEALEPESKRSIIKQIAQILKHIQDYTLPNTVKGYGGLAFAGHGAIVVGGTPFPGGGPATTHSALYAEYLDTQMARSEQCKVVKGWKNTKIPSRIAQLVNAFSGVREWEKDLRPTLVHGDFDIHNLLFDPAANQITGVVDFDLAHIGCQVEEYMWSLFSLGHLLLPVDESNEDIRLHRQFLLYGLKDPTAELLGRSKGLIDWDITLLTDEEFAKAGVILPRDVPALEQIQTRYLATQAISPPVFFQAKTLTYSLETMEKMRQGEQKELESCLDQLGC